MRTKVRVSISLRLFKDGELVVRTTRRVKSRILLAAQKPLWDKASLRAVYDCHRGYANYAECESFELLEKMLSLFTEKPLLDHLAD